MLVVIVSGITFGPSGAAAAAVHTDTRTGATGVRAHGASSECRPGVVFIRARGTGEGKSGFGTTISAVCARVEAKFRSTGRLFADSLDRSCPALHLSDLYLGYWERYAAGVRAGLDAVVGRDRCRNRLHVMLAGYSAGGWAVGDAYLRMTDAQRRVVVGGALFGDPRNDGDLYWHGIYDAGHPWAEGEHGRVWNSCLSLDPVCHADVARTLARLGLCLKHSWCAHFGYAEAWRPLPSRPAHGSRIVSVSDEEP